jgi:hypothetical protein
MSTAIVLALGLTAVALGVAAAMVVLAVGRQSEERRRHGRTLQLDTPPARRALSASSSRTRTRATPTPLEERPRVGLGFSRGDLRRDTMRAEAPPRELPVLVCEGCGIELPIPVNQPCPSCGSYSFVAAPASRFRLGPAAVDPDAVLEVVREPELGGTVVRVPLLDDRGAVRLRGGFSNLPTRAQLTDEAPGGDAA